MDAEHRWIADRESLERALVTLGEGPLGIDLEADSFHRYQERLCLIQLSNGRDHFLVDPLSQLELAPLIERLVSPDRIKVMHGADYDARVLHRDLGVGLRGLFDTAVAARFVGHRAFGLAAMLDRYLGVTLDKQRRLDDWARRPLPARSIAYAIADVRHLGALKSRLEQELDRLGRREWAEEEFRQVEQARFETAPRDFRSVKGSGTLGRRGLAIVRELYDWRDRRGRRLDRPPTRVLSDRGLVSLARAEPRELDALRGVPRLPRALLRPPLAIEVLEAIERALAQPEEAWPARRRSDGGAPLSPGEVRRAETLRRLRDRAAERLGLDPALLMPRAMVEGIARRLESGSDWRDMDGLRRWQADHAADWIRLSERRNVP